MTQVHSFSSCLQSSMLDGATSNMWKRMVKLLFILYFLLWNLFIHAGSCMGEAHDGSDYNARGSPMDPDEEEAFYNVLQALNHELDWRTLYTDPCGESSPQGANCEEVNGVWHLISLSFGPVYENTPPCAYDASIHPSIAQLTHLKSLSFYQCFMHTNTSIPPEIGNLKASLQSLTFIDNEALVGEIPATFGELLNLERLVIYGAKLEGGIPTTLGQLANLVQLDLSNNQLGGAIPSSLAKVRSLIVLDLSRNSLNGNIPAKLGGLLAMEKMDLSRNKLGGWIPVEIGDLKALKLLDMSYNTLQGKIPSSFGGLSSLQGLYVNSNSFNGVLPSGIWSSLHHLQSIDLSNAGFAGPIPATLSFLHNLRFLSLANNKFTGEIPHGLSTLSHLYLLHLNGNNLSGQLPFTPAFVARLGLNLLLYDNENLCSNAPNILQGLNNNLRICSSSSTGAQDAHQLTSTSTMVSNLTQSSSAPPPSLPSLLLAFLICIVDSFVLQSQPLYRLTF